MEQLSLGVCGTSRKENKHRLPIHPLHLDRIDVGLRARRRDPQSEDSFVPATFQPIPAHPDVSPAEVQAPPLCADAGLSPVTMLAAPIRSIWVRASSRRLLTFSGARRRTQGLAPAGPQVMEHSQQARRRPPPEAQVDRQGQVPRAPPASQSACARTASSMPNPSCSTTTPGQRPSPPGRDGSPGIPPAGVGIVTSTAVCPPSVSKPWPA